MTSTPGGKIAGGIIGGLVVAYIVFKKYQYNKKKENTNEEYQQEIDQRYIKIPGQVPTIQTLTTHTSSNYTLDNNLIMRILNENLTLEQYISEQTEIYPYMPKQSMKQHYNIHNAEAKHIQEAERAAKKANRNQAVEAKRIQEAKEAAERAAAEAKRIQEEKAAEHAAAEAKSKQEANKAKEAAERAVENAKRNQEVKETANRIQIWKEVAKNTAAYAKRNQEVKEKAKRIQKIVTGIQLPEYLREAEQSNINREQLIREFATYATIYKDERAAAEVKRKQEAEKLKEADMEEADMEETAAPLLHPYTSVPSISTVINDDGDEEFFNAQEFFNASIPNKSKTTGSSKKSKKHKRRTRRRHKKN
jgi:hypothetical protein